MRLVLWRRFWFTAISAVCGALCCLSLIAPPAHAQDALIEVDDLSWLTYTGPDGFRSYDLMVYFSVNFVGGAGGWWDYVSFGMAEVPGAVSPEHNDCSCYWNSNQIFSGYLNQGTVYAWSSYPTMTRPSSFYVEVWWNLVMPVVYSWDCGEGCFNCQDPANYAMYYDYYGTVIGAFEVWDGDGGGGG